ncbi:MAG TPA: hypothetical protein VMZ71_03360 [Gemmataceae bacterium]|nr:hypothetical protein [Gemmataceae bacterium]
MTSGLVVTLAPDASEWESALVALSAAPPITVGDRNGDRLSVALEAETAEESERWTDWLSQLRGVCGVEVVFVHWDDAEVTHDRA